MRSSAHFRPAYPCPIPPGVAACHRRHALCLVPCAAIHAGAATPHPGTHRPATTIRAGFHRDQPSLPDHARQYVFSHGGQCGAVPRPGFAHWWRYLPPPNICHGIRRVGRCAASHRCAVNHPASADSGRTARQANHYTPILCQFCQAVQAVECPA